MPVGLDEIRAAAARIAGVASRTPVMRSRTFDARSGLRTFFKCENFQRGGAFKIRGAANAVLSLEAEHLRRGVVSYSSGNHAQAVAIAAAHAGVPAVIAMPEDAPESKLEATRGYGAEVILYDRLRENRARLGERIAAERRAVLIPPYDHPAIIAGQGTCALELLEEVGELDALVVPVGGGGLISGCALAAHGMREGIRVFGVEPADGNDTFLSLEAGRPVEIPPPGTIADGLRAQSPGKLTFPILRRLVERIILVSDDEILEAVRFLLLRMKLVVEPSGAAAAAALLARKLPEGITRAGVVLSGGNLDYELLARLRPGAG